MTAESYRVRCLFCKGEDVLKITADRQVFYTKHTPIISARFRPTMDWGFECGDCGNDSRIAPEEKDQIETLVKGGEHAIQAIKDSLKITKPKFSMEQI
jgi:hypothetical protein